MPRKIEERIQELKRLEGGDAAEPFLRKALRDKSNLMVAEAAKITALFKRIQLIPDLLDALERLFKDPVKNDSKCWGKTAIVKALTDLEFSEAAPFLRASRHVQMEPVWGGQEDAAIHLRASAVLALVQCDDLRRPETLRYLVDALADPSDTVRIEAVRAIEQMNGEEGAVLLRLKAHTGDRRATVSGQVFDSILQLERERGIEFVARFMESANVEIRDEAALALGASRLPLTVDLLIKAWNNSRTLDFSATLLRALSSSREEAALAFLLNLVARGDSRNAQSALEALALHPGSPEILARVEQARRDRSAGESD